MKKYYKAAKIPTARQLNVKEGRDAALSFAREVGYPLIAKPDVGVGAGGTYKIHDDGELDAFFRKAGVENYVIEEFVTGDICSYDAIVDRTLAARAIPPTSRILEWKTRVPNRKA